MATHSTNTSNGTHIIGSTVSIDTLNVNKTSTHEEILNSLPSYHSIDSSSFDETTNTVILQYPVSIDHINNSMFFINGNALTKLAQPTDQGPGYFLTADGTTLTIKDSAPLSTSQIHGLYTSVS